MWNEKETLYLSPEITFAFGISKELWPPKENPDEGYAIQPLAVSATDTDVKITANIEGKKTELSYKKDALTPMQSCFIGWAYLLMSDGWEAEKANKKQATYYLHQSVKDEIGLRNRMKDDSSPIPYFLISKHDLRIDEIRDIKSHLYHFVMKPRKWFRDLYLQLLRKERNPIRKIGIAKIALGHYPHDEHFVGIIADDLYMQRKYQACITMLQAQRKDVTKEAWADMYDLRLTLFKSYIAKKDFEGARKDLNVPIRIFHSDDYTALMKGIAYCHQKKWKEAIKSLEEAVIEDYTDTGVTSLASYYLIDCYFSLKNIPKLEEVIASFNLQHDEFLNTGALPVDYRDILPKILKRAIKCDGLDEMSVAKLKGMQAYVTQEIIPQYHDLKIKRTSKTLEGKVINEALKLTEEALAFYPSEGFFNTLYSNLLYNASQPDKAMDYKLRSIAKKDNGGLYANVSLSDCTEEYINNYAENLKKIFGEIDGDAARNYVEGYDFDSDVGTLWDRKLYAQISELYKFIKPQITDYSKIGELSDVLKGGGLFEVAYSLNESGDVDMAREAYEMHIKTKGESSAAYNNLAIIYEKKKNAAKAIELIKKAKELAGPDDELVNRNYQRICGNKQNDTQRPKAEASVPRSKPKLSFDEKTGQVHFGKNSVEIPLGSNQYQLCKAVFGVPIGTWVNESDVVDNFFRGKESKRGFYDAVRLANTRIEGELKVPRLIEYVASRARIRKEAMT